MPTSAGPINPNFPSSIATGNIPVEPSLQRRYRNAQEARAAWQAAQLYGGGNVLPLEAYLGNVMQPGDPGYGDNGGGGGVAGGGPGYGDGGVTPMTAYQQALVDQAKRDAAAEEARAEREAAALEARSKREADALAAERAAVEIRSQRGVQTGRSLPDDVRQRYQAILDNLGNEPTPESRALALRSLMPLIDAPGYTADERASLEISPEEEAGTIRLSGLPVAGAAKRAEQSLMRYTDAYGGNPGMNATAQRIQQTYGQQAAEAALKAKLGIITERRAGTKLIGDARSRDITAGQQGAQSLLNSDLTNAANIRNTRTTLLTSYPEWSSTENPIGPGIPTIGNAAPTSYKKSRDSSLMPLVV